MDGGYYHSVTRLYKLRRLGLGNAVILKSPDKIKTVNPMGLVLPVKTDYRALPKCPELG